MEIQHPNYSIPVFKGIVQKCDPQLQMCFLQFLQTEIILNIALLAKKYKKQQYFYRLAMVLVYFRKYLNRVDRSMYYLFYDQKEFKPLEQTFIINIAKKQSNLFFLLRDGYQKQLDHFNQQAVCVQDKQEMQNILQTIFFQTDYPLPPCKRQTIGVYCQTPFQTFMAMIRFPSVQSPDQYIEPPLQQLRNYFLQTMQMQKIVQLIHQNGSQNIKKMSILRYCPYQLQLTQANQQFIENFELHNLIVILYKLVSINAQSSYMIVNEHQDPIMRMAQFVTRANIYKNIILAIQEKFGFLFQTYGDIFEVISKGQNSANLPKFQFWNGALTIWVQKFQGLQNKLYESFNYVLLKERETNTANFLTQKSNEFPSLYNPLKLQLEKKSLFQQKKSQLYKETGVSYEEFFENNVDSYEILAKDFLEHQVDISINEINVHKCGHSDHVIKRVPFFRNFIDQVKENSNLFYSHLQKIIFKKNSDKNDKKMRISLLKDLIKCDLDFVDGKFTKPVILKQIYTSAKSLIQSLAQKLPEFAVFTEEALQKFGLHVDFTHKDNLLDYFCTKSQTPNDCIQKLRCFYDTYKNKSIEEMLNLALNVKDQSQLVESEIEEECYESSMSNHSVLSIDEE